MKHLLNCLACFAALAVIGSAQNNPYRVLLQIEGVDGDVRTPGYVDWHEAERCRFAIDRPLVGGTAVGLGELSEMVVDVQIGTSFAELVSACASGTPRSVTVHMLRQGSRPELDFGFVLRDVLLSGVGASGHAGIAALRMQFFEIEWNHYVQGQLQSSRSFDARTDGRAWPTGNEPESVGADSNPFFGGTLQLGGTPGPLEVLDYSCSVANASAIRSGPGQVQVTAGSMAPVSILLPFEPEVAPELGYAAVTGTRLPTATLAAGIPGLPYLTVAMTDAVIHSLRIDGGVRGSSVRVELVFDTVDWTFDNPVTRQRTSQSYDLVRDGVEFVEDEPAEVRPPGVYGGWVRIAGAPGPTFGGPLSGWHPMFDFEHEVRLPITTTPGVAIRQTGVFRSPPMSLSLLAWDALPQLLEDSVAGRRIAEVEVQVTIGGTTIAEIKLLDARITEVEQCGADFRMRVGLSADRIEWTSIDFQTGARTTRTWDFVINRRI